MGKAWEPVSSFKERCWNVLLIAFGQKKMFKQWVPGIFHLFIYVAFLLTQVELLEILVDGLTGSHRFFRPVLGPFYFFLIGTIEILSLLALVGTIVFLVRRKILAIPRLQSPELRGWPTLDAQLILLLEIVLIFFIFLMNSADNALHSNSYPFVLSRYLLPIMQPLSPQILLVLERVGWWGHILVVFVFLGYLAYSKHLHILMAFINTYFADTRPRGKLENIPAISNEVRSMLGLSESESGSEPLEDFGSSDVMQLTWKNLMDAYTCTECGRCTDVCPANLTGKKLSPRKIMMDIRDRTEEVGKKLAGGDVIYCRDKNLPLTSSNFSDDKSLFDLITPEEIHACTTCNACVEACPVMINPVEPIIQLRRYEILTLSEGPPDWLPLFNSLENNQAAWSLSTNRSAWRQNARF